MATVEPAGVRKHFTFNYQGSEYRVFETDPRRPIDRFRFELWKQGAAKPYVVAFQDDQGLKSACSCPAGLYHRAAGECRHVKMCRSEFLAGVPRAPERPAQAKPSKSSGKLTGSGSGRSGSGQLALPGIAAQEMQQLVAQLDSLKARYRAKKAEIARLTAGLAEIEREGRLARDRLNHLRARGSN